MSELAPLLLPWFNKFGRHGLPWQKNINPYRIWISEIMLQQTQVKTVIPYYNKFIRQFPEVGALAKSDLDPVLHLWSGLGYYARARNMHRAARLVQDGFDGEFPRELETLMSLPGIGRTTAGAILALSLNRPYPVLDGNVKRVLIRYYGVYGWPGHKQVEDGLWEMAERNTARRKPAAYTQAIMDLGATVCLRSRPRCVSCPLTSGCYAFEKNQQHLLPTKKSKKPMPVRQVVFAVLENQEGEVLLEKRPAAGVWGGLWSFPEYDSSKALTTWISRNHFQKTDKLITLPKVRHTFSHFHLEITPVKTLVAEQANGVQDSDKYLWYSPLNDLEIGMAAPVKKLIERIYSTDAAPIADDPAA